MRDLRSVVSLFALMILAGTVAALGQGGRPNISGNVALSSDYVFRGISQTQEDPALQAELNLRWSEGFHLDFWASNVDFGSTAEAELDVTFGWKRGLSKKFAIDVGLTRFILINESSLDYNEPYIQLSWADNLALALRYTSDLGGTGIDSSYIEINYTVSLPEELRLGLHTGRTAFSGAMSTVVDYMVSLGRKFGKVDVHLAFWDTDLSDSPLAEERGVLTLSFDF